MHVLQVCAEIFPLLKTGGLADVAGALPAALAAQGARVRVLLPGFPAILAGLEGARPLARLAAPAALAPVEARLLFGRLPACGVEAYVIDAPAFYRRAGGPYADAHHQPYADNHLRFALLGWAAARLAGGLDTGWAPDVVHCHDWHAGLAPACLRAEAERRGQAMPPSLFTIHNLAYQGAFDAARFGELGLPAHFFSMHGVEFHGQLNFMKAGLYYADRISTVSPSYAREIQSYEQGCGFDGLLRAHNPDFAYVDHNAQGYASATLTAAALTVVYNKVKPLNADGTAPASPLLKRTRITLAAGSRQPVVQDNA